MVKMSRSLAVAFSCVFALFTTSAWSAVVNLAPGDSFGMTFVASDPNPPYTVPNFSINDARYFELSWLVYEDADLGGALLGAGTGFTSNLGQAVQSAVAADGAVSIKFTAQTLLSGFDTTFRLLFVDSAQRETTVTGQFTPVSEPASLALAGIALAAAVAAHRRRERPLGTSAPSDCA